MTRHVRADTKQPEKPCSDCGCSNFQAAKLAEILEPIGWACLRCGLLVTEDDRVYVDIDGIVMIEDPE